MKFEEKVTDKLSLDDLEAVNGGVGNAFVGNYDVGTVDAPNIAQLDTLYGFLDMMRQMGFQIQPVLDATSPSALKAALNAVGVSDCTDVEAQVIYNYLKNK